MVKVTERTNIIKTNVPIHITIDDIALNILLFAKPLGDDKLTNHNYLKGQFMRAAHKECNINFMSLNTYLFSFITWEDTTVII